MYLFTRLYVADPKYIYNFFAGLIMKFISTGNAPKPGGHYSQAVVQDNLVYVAGQLPFDPDTGEKVLGSIGEQTYRVLLNLEAILIAAGTGRSNVLKTTVYIADINQWGEVNKVFAEFFGDHKPARAVVPTPPLHFGFLIEIEAVAVIP